MYHRLTRNKIGNGSNGETGKGSGIQHECFRNHGSQELATLIVKGKQDAIR